MTFPAWASPPPKKRRDIFRYFINEIQLEEHPVLPVYDAVQFPAPVVKRYKTTNRYHRTAGDIAGNLNFGSEFSFPVITGSLTALAFLGPRYRVYFYEPSTTTDKPVYGDNLAITQHSNPVLCDRFGNLPAIWKTPGETYRVVVKNQFDVFLYEEDI